MGHLKEISRRAAEAEDSCKMRRPLTIATVVLLVLGGLGLYWLWPEIQRYARIKRM